MILEALRAARRLDQKLDEKLGRPYRVVLSIALIGEIVQQIKAFFALHFTLAHLGQLIFPLLVGLALLINQLGEMSQRMENRGAGRQRGRTLHP